MISITTKELEIENDLKKKIKTRDDRIEELEDDLESANDTIDELEDKEITPQVKRIKEADYQEIADLIGNAKANILINGLKK